MTPKSLARDQVEFVAVVGNGLERKLNSDMAEGTLQRKAVAGKDFAIAVFGSEQARDARLGKGIGVYSLAVPDEMLRQLRNDTGGVPFWKSQAAYAPFVAAVRGYVEDQYRNGQQ